MIWIFWTLLFIFGGTFAYAGIKAAPWFSTWSYDLVRFSELAGIKAGEKFYDLGCGDGKIVFAAAGAGAEAVGFEISLLPYLIAKINSRYVENAKILFKDFWKVNLSDADIVYCFLTPKANKKLKEKLESELKKGARVVAYTWPIEGWTPVKSNFQTDHAAIYVYVM